MSCGLGGMTNDAMGYVHCPGNEHRVPDVAPRTVPQVVAETGDGDTVDVLAGDPELGLFPLQSLDQRLRKVGYACRGFAG